MEHIITDFWHLFTAAGFLALVNIIIIDIVMSGDNAIVIGMATKNLPEHLRKKAIMVWIVLATLLRIVFALFATVLLQISWLRFAGWVLLLYVVWKFYKELRTGGDHHDDSVSWKVKQISFASAIWTLVIADVSMSLDNVLAVAGASHGNIVTLGIWLVVSILLMAFASNYIAKKLNDFPIIQWVGLLVILFVAIEMLIKWTPDIEQTIQITNLLPFFIFAISLLFIFLHQKYMKALDTAKIQIFLQKHYLKIFSLFFLIMFLMINIWDIIIWYLQSHQVFIYSANFIILFLFLEVVSLLRNKK